MQVLTRHRMRARERAANDSIREVEELLCEKRCARVIGAKAGQVLCRLTVEVGLVVEEPLRVDGSGEGGNIVLVDYFCHACTHQTVCWQTTSGNHTQNRP